MVERQNGAGVDGLASRAVDYLSELGFLADSLTAANAAGSLMQPETEIIDFSGVDRKVDNTVGRLASLLSVPEERIRSANDGDGELRTTDADILVILGADSEGRLLAGGGEPSGG